MATDFQLIKTIDQQTKDIVSGYIRQTQLLIAVLYGKRIFCDLWRLH